MMKISASDREYILILFQSGTPKYLIHSNSNSFYELSKYTYVRKWSFEYTMEM